MLVCISAWTPTPYGNLACGDALSEAAVGHSILTEYRHRLRCRAARFSLCEICRPLQGSGLSHHVDVHNHMVIGPLPRLSLYLQ
jgi:hypothetical protein